MFLREWAICTASTHWAAAKSSHFGCFARGANWNRSGHASRHLRRCSSASRRARTARNSCLPGELHTTPPLNGSVRRRGGIAPIREGYRLLQEHLALPRLHFDVELDSAGIDTRAVCGGGDRSDTCMARYFSSALRRSNTDGGQWP